MKTRRPDFDAPDGTVIDGFERVGGRWIPVDVNRDEDVQLVRERIASVTTTLDGQTGIRVGGRRKQPTVPVDGDERVFRLPEDEPPGWADP